MIYITDLVLLTCFYFNIDILVCHILYLVWHGLAYLICITLHAFTYIILTLLHTLASVPVLALLGLGTLAAQALDVY